jgi:hypothetical protein
VYSIGTGLFGTDVYVFNVLNIGYTGTTFNNGTTGTFKRVINPDNLEETRSEYYIKQYKVLTNLTDLAVTKVGFEKNVFAQIATQILIEDSLSFCCCKFMMLLRIYKGNHQFRI